MKFNEKIKKMSKYVILLLILTIPFIFLTQVKADSGWDTGYDSGGYDSGGYSGGWDYDSYDHDYGHSSSSSSGYNNYSYTWDAYDFVIIIIVVAVLIWIYVYSRSKKDAKVNRTPNFYESISEDKLKEIIPGYSIDELKAIAVEKFINIQNAWMEFNYEELRKLCTDELFNSYKIQLETLKLKNGKNIMSDFKSLFCHVTDVRVENNNYIVTFTLRMEFYDYVIDTKTDKVIRGNKYDKVTNTYTLEFVKSVSKTDDEKCPNCGAPIKGSASNVCDYCGSTIVKDASDFVLSKKNIRK